MNTRFPPDDERVPLEELQEREPRRQAMPPQMPENDEHEGMSTRKMVLWGLLGLIVLAGLLALGFIFGRKSVAAAPIAATPTSTQAAAPANISPTLTNGMVPLTCGDKVFSLIPPPAPYVGYKCDDNGQPAFINISVATVPPAQPGNGNLAPAAANACAYNGDPIAPNAYTPANVYVLDETVKYDLKTVSSTFYFTAIPVQALISGQTHHNLWIYCSRDDANKGAQTEFAERSSEASQPGWANGFSVSAPTEGTASSVVSTACAYNGDPIGPNLFTPMNVYVLDETVNYAQKTVTSTFYFTSVPVQATINGQIHHNLWIYCSRDAANFGAQTEFAERSSEASQPGWANGFSVSAPFGR